MADIADRRVWDLMLAPFDEAQRQMQEQAAMAEADDHMRMRGRYEGFKHAVLLLHEVRNRLIREPL